MANTGLITGDWHLVSSKRFATIKEGINSRLYEKILACSFMVEQAKQQEVGVIFNLGDIFDSTSDYVDKISVLIGTNLIRKCVEICPTIIVAGNHDIVKDKVWINFLPCAVITEPIVMSIIGLKFGIVPWQQSIKQFLKSISQFSDCDYILAHQGIEGARSGSYVSDGPLPQKYSGTIPVISGHYHAFQTVKNFTYVGSPLQQDFEEVGQEKGFLILDKDGMVFNIIANSPQFHNILLTKEEDLKIFLDKYNEKDYYNVKVTTPIIDVKQLPSSERIIMSPYLETYQFEEEKENINIKSPEELIVTSIEESKANVNKELWKQTALEIWEKSQ